MSSPLGSAVDGVLDGDLAVAVRQHRAGRARRGEEADLVGREVSLEEDLAHGDAHLTGGADDADADTHQRPRPAVDDGLDLVGVEVERGVRRRDSGVDVDLVDDDGDADLRGRDHPDVHAGLGDRGEELRGDTGVRAHAGTDQRDLADLVVVEQRVEADLGLERVERRHRGLPVGARQREGDVGEVGRGGRDVLDDHVEVDLGLGERVEDAGGLADLVGYADHGDLRLAPVVRDAGDDGCFHGGLLMGLVVDAARDHGAVQLAERGPHVDRDVVAAGVLDAPQVQDLRAAGGQLEHLLVGDARRACGRVGTIRGSAVKTPSTSV